jgi:hypothetical protein
LKPIHEEKKNKNQKQTYHLRFDLIKHKFIRKGGVHFSCKIYQANWQIILGQVERISPKIIIVGEVHSFKPFGKNGQKVRARAWQRDGQ